MNTAQRQRIQEAKDAALEVLRHNLHGPYAGLPRTAGWGYPEPYTRDMMISALGMLVSDDPALHTAVRQVLEALAKHQTEHGHIASLANDPGDVGASDTTPLFLMGVALYRRFSGEEDFLREAADRALVWMAHQSPGDSVIVGQLPTSDWRDEQWVLGYGLFVNTIVYLYLRLFGHFGEAYRLREEMTNFDVTPRRRHRHELEGIFILARKPYYALWSYKVYHSERFDLLGNSLAVLVGLASPTRARALLEWVEVETARLRAAGELAVDLPPNFFPYIQPGDDDWLPRYTDFNMPGDYHNGGIWPFICGFYVAALVAAGMQEVAEAKLLALTDLVRLANDHDVAYGFNEWIRAHDGTPRGNDWQTWSAALYLYAAACVEAGKPLLLEELQG